jgi:ribosomal protein S18 acetylase RimI-like enzyme
LHFWFIAKKENDMPLTYWDMGDAHRLTEFYNEQIADIPHCYAVSADEFQQGLVLDTSSDTGTQDNAAWREQLIVEETQGTILGFIHLAIKIAIKTVEADTSQGYIRFLTYERGQRRAGQQLLAAGERYFRAAQVRSIDAFLPYQGYRFYHVGRGFVVDRWAHVYGLLGINKYRIRHAQVFMEKALVEGSEPVLPTTDANLSLSVEVGPQDAPQVSVTLARDGQVVGECDARPVGQLQRSRKGARQFYIPGLWVTEDLRGIGLGRYLVERLHWEMLQRGYDHALIGTELDNYRAQQLYASDGYELLLNEYSFAKYRF